MIWVIGPTSETRTGPPSASWRTRFVRSLPRFAQLS